MKAKQSIVIVGSGYAGLTMAIALSNLHNVEVTIIERKDKLLPNIENAHHKTPGRLFSITKQSASFFENIGITSIQNIGQPINHIRVFDYESGAKLDFAPEDIGEECFGYMIDERNLMAELQLKLTNTDVKVIYAANVTSLSKQSYHRQVVLEDSLTINADLIIGADGRQSTIRKLAHIETQIKDYAHVANIFSIKHEEEHCGVAVEQFMKHGPFAVLPQRNQHISSVVWIEQAYRRTLIENLEPEQLHELMALRLNGYLGNFEILHKPKCFDLTMINARNYTAEKIALIGDAAYSIHPLAGQGLNLGLKGISVLYELIKEYTALGLDVGGKLLLDEYNVENTFSANVMIEGINFINSSFACTLPFIKPARAITLTLLDKFKAAKSLFMKYASGL